MEDRGRLGLLGSSFLLLLGGLVGDSRFFWHRQDLSDIRAEAALLSNDVAASGGVNAEHAINHGRRIRQFLGALRGQLIGCQFGGKVDVSNLTGLSVGDFQERSVFAHPEVDGGADF